MMYNFFFRFLFLIIASKSLTSYCQENDDLRAQLLIELNSQLRDKNSEQDQNIFPNLELPSGFHNIQNDTQQNLAKQDENIFPNLELPNGLQNVKKLEQHNQVEKTEFDPKEPIAPSPPSEPVEPQIPDAPITPEVPLIPKIPEIPLAPLPPDAEMIPAIPFKLEIPEAPEIKIIPEASQQPTIAKEKIKEKPITNNIEKEKLDILGLNTNILIEEKPKLTQIEKNKEIEPSFGDKIKNLFTSKNEEINQITQQDQKINLNPKIEAPQKPQQKPIAKQNIVNKEKSDHQSELKKLREGLKKEIETPIDSKYENKIYEYNSKKNTVNTDSYKIKTKMPDFLENHEDSLGNKHLPKIYHYEDYIRTLFLAIDDEDISAMDRLFKILKSNEVNSFKGETPLTYAVKNYKKKVVNYLLLRGYDKNVKNKYGETPYNIALKKNYYDIALILKNN